MHVSCYMSYKYVSIFLLKKNRKSLQFKINVFCVIYIYKKSISVDGVLGEYFWILCTEWQTLHIHEMFNRNSHLSSTKYRYFSCYIKFLISAGNLFELVLFVKYLYKSWLSFMAVIFYNYRILNFLYWLSKTFIFLKALLKDNS